MTTVVLQPHASRLDDELADAQHLHASFELPLSFDVVPAGYRRGSTREAVGSGGADYEAARQSVSEWAFLPRWIRPYPAGVAQEPGQTLLVVANTFGLHWLLPTRILSSIADDGGAPRGFVYVALDGHIARGYERFVVDLDPTTSIVSFDVTAVASPTHPILRLFPAAFRVVQWYFRHASVRRLRGAVRDRTR